MTSALRKLAAVLALVVGVVFASTAVHANATPTSTTPPVVVTPAPTPTTTPTSTPSGPVITPMDWWWK